MVLEPILDEGRMALVHRAGWVMVDADTVIRNGFVRVKQGIIQETGRFGKTWGDAVVDHGEGLLMPAFVNAHTHLELSALKGKLAFGRGFSSWVRELLTLRESTGVENLADGIGAGVDELLYSGVLVAGDVSTLGIVARHVRNSPLAGVLFREYLGNAVPEPEGLETAGRFLPSLAGHAPHTTSPAVLKHLKETCRKEGRPFSIHLAESEEESEFITTGKGVWADFLKERGVDYRAWGLPFKSPVAYLDHLGLLDPNTLAVHLIRGDREDIRTLKKRGVAVCLCPRSNRNLHGVLPDIETMVDEGVLLCLGTDSLASTESLSVLDEMRALAQAFPRIPLRDIVRMATANGAAALGLEKSFGRLWPGKRAAMVYVDMKVETEQTLFENLLS